MLRDERRKQRVHRIHDVAVAMDLEAAVFLDRANSLILHISCDHARERAAQIGREHMAILVLVQVQVAHVFMGRRKRLLEFMVDLQQPVEVIRIALFLAEFSHRLDAGMHFLSEQAKRNVLGLNAARLFNLEVPGAG